MDTEVKVIRSLDNPRKKVLFLGYTPGQTTLIDTLISSNCEVWHTQKKIESTQGYDFVVSYGYRYILKKSIIESSNAPIINLHISYLPWNRGAHPNFWSFFDCTPSGVSIHLIDEGVDTGPILYQRYVNFTKEQTTFSQTYKKLHIEIEALFKECIEEIIEGTYTTTPQRRKGTYHTVGDLPKEFSGWDANIQAEICRLDSLIFKSK
ncbi:formyltransferase family protein [Pollutimonas sp. H1-120]|uniref:formyltransferase family protein n=1 Tax=Pollutimonas sp. H1-120 TaxID=3148824 RepID=UPI003B51C1A3